MAPLVSWPRATRAGERRLQHRGLVPDHPPGPAGNPRVGRGWSTHVSMNVCIHTFFCTHMCALHGIYCFGDRGSRKIVTSGAMNEMKSCRKQTASAVLAEARGRLRVPFWACSTGSKLGNQNNRSCHSFESFYLALPLLGWVSFKHQHAKFCKGILNFSATGCQPRLTKCLLLASILASLSWYSGAHCRYWWQCVSSLMSGSAEG